jgi:hypothetical protein
LRLDEKFRFFSDDQKYRQFQKIGQKHLNDQKAKWIDQLEEYVKDEIIDGTKIQDDWFPEIEADIFISHSGKDVELANAFAGWLNKTFELKCFVDANVWGYSKTLLDKMNSLLSNKGEEPDGDLVSQHVNMMLSIALQKMIDKAEAVILLNTDNAIKVRSDTHMEETYSPWIYSEIICTQLIRKKPLLDYRDYTKIFEKYVVETKSQLFALHFAVSYKVSLNHLGTLSEEDLKQWENEWKTNKQEYDDKYPLDALYKKKCPQELESTRRLSDAVALKKVSALGPEYSVNCRNSEGWIEMQYALEEAVYCGLPRREICCYREWVRRNGDEVPSPGICPFLERRLD